MPASIQVSFLIPVYNEELNIARVLKNLYDVLNKNRGWNCEVIVVEDGSKDKSREMVLRAEEQYPALRVIVHDKNQGYTASLRDGIRASQGKFLMYVGADEEFDSTELPQFINPLLRNEADIVLGVRWQRNAYQLFRFFLSVVYIFFLNGLFKLRINDYNWSQAWPRVLFNEIELKSKSLFVLPEIIIRAHDLRYRIKEVPSNHRGRQFGKSSINLRIMVHALLDALAFWRYRRSGQYTPHVRPGLIAESGTKRAASPTRSPLTT